MLRPTQPDSRNDGINYKSLLLSHFGDGKTDLLFAAMTGLGPVEERQVFRMESGYASTLPHFCIAKHGSLVHTSGLRVDPALSPSTASGKMSFRPQSNNEPAADPP